MKRIYIYLAVMATLLIGGGKAIAQSVTIDGVTYGINGNNASITGASNASGDIVIPDSVTIAGVVYPVEGIHRAAFQNSTGLTSIVLPQQITNISPYAFDGCTSLTSVTLPSNLEYLSGWVFQNCSALTSITLPDRFIGIGTGAFQGCTSLISVDILSAQSIGESAFANCNNLSSVSLPYGLKSIERLAFSGCSNLTDISMPVTVTRLVSSAFNSTGITYTDEDNIRYLGTCAIKVIDNTLTDYSIKDGTANIVDECFANCVNMTTVSIPNSVVFAGENVFSGCTGLPIEGGIRYADCYAVEVTDKTLSEYTLKDNVRFLGYALFQDCKAMTSAKIPAGVTELGSNVFYGCTALTSLTLPEVLTSIGAYACYDCSSLTSVNLPVGVKSIDTYAFFNCSSLSSLILPESLVNIGSCAFYGCSSVTKLHIPATVEKIGFNALVALKSLNELYLKFESVPSSDVELLFSDMSGRSINIISYMKGVPQLLCTGSYTPSSHGGGGYIPTNVRLFVPKGYHNAYKTLYPNHEIFEVVEDQDFVCEDYVENGIRYFNTVAYELTDSSLTEFVIRDGTTIINSNLFSDCSSLTSLTLPESVTSIGAYAFSGCSSLTSLTLPKSVTSIGAYAFSGCSSLTSLTLPESVTSIGAYTFYGCSALASVNIPSGVTVIGSYAFSNCTSLTSLTLPETVTSIGARAFNICSSLESINIPIGVALIDEWTFAGCSSLTSITLPETVTSIGHRAFQSCEKLRTITLSKKLTDIGSYAFDGCRNLRKIINYSDLQLTKGNSSYGYVAAYAQQIINVDEIVDDYYYFDTDSNGKHYLTYYEGTDSILTLPSYYQGESYSVDYAVFSGHSEIVSVQLPETVISIGASAFSGCSSLTSLTLPESVTSIGASVFSGCSSLTSLALPESVTSIGGSAFYNCSSLTSVNIPSRVPSIGDNTFYGCSSLTSLTLPESVTSIGASAFYGCSSLTSMIIPSNVTSIGNYAFYNCFGIKELTIADSGETLSLGHNTGYNPGLFGYCSLEKLYLGRNLNYSTSHYDGGYSPFANVNTLKEVVVGDSVTSVGAYAFRQCSSLNSIYLPDSLTSIGSEAFYGCNSLIYVHCDFESPSVLFWSYLRTQAVIYVPKGTYVAYKETFPNNIIVDGEANEVTVDITIPGTLGEEVLNQVAYLRGVNSLKVSGTLNDDDISTITESMVNLLHLDLSKTSMTSVNGIGHANLCSIVFPDSCKTISGYSERDNLTSIILPDAVETLGDNCFGSCDQLTEVTMSVNLKTVGSNAFAGCSKIEKMSFAHSVSVGSWAFSGCSNLRVINVNGSIFSYGRSAFSGCNSITEIHIPNIEAWLYGGFNEIYSDNFPNQVSSISLYIDGELLTDVVIPSSVTSIRSYAFSNIKSITSVTIPKNVTSIGDKVFSGCTGLKEVTMSEGIKTIPSEAFYDCDNLASIVIPEGVTTIQNNAFAQCYNLRSITLPSTLNNCAAGAFSGSGLTEVTCPAFFPPVTGGDLIGANNCTLYVPEWTLNRYKLANNWNLFAAIEPISGIYPSGISVYTVESLVIPAEGLAEGYKPNLEVVRYDNSNVGRLTMRGEKAMPLSTFKMEQTRDAGTMTSLVNYGTLTADSVVTEVSFSTNTWHYLTFPYDVKISDIATLGDWVIRRYDGASRARADFSSTWQNVPYDSILHAGEGYIWYSTNGNFTVPAIKNDNRNLIFANDARYTQLKEHASATQANYGWNLIGNPYPCFYDSRFIEYGSPITVRSGNSYQAYSPVDDSYILSPLEAFFVQCSADNNIVGFEPEGRQTDNTPRALTSAPKRTRAVSSDRSVFNLYLENGSYADHTRFVINESASLAYEIACDAAKFMSDDPAVQQLFTIEGEERMAINERPFANGEVALGAYFGKSGSYTIALDTRVTEMEVVLVDKFTGVETDLMTDSYTFTTEAGTFTDRFAIRMKRTGVVDAIEAAAAAKVQVTALSGAISIMNAAAPVSIYNAAGALVAIMDGGDATVEVAPGMYIVKVGDEIHKISVIK